MLLLVAHMVVLPEIGPGVTGTVLTTTISDCGVDDPHTLLAVTVMLPAEVPAVASIESVVDDPLHVDGSVQVYDVAPDTAVIEYVLRLPEQIVVLPVIGPGVAGMLITFTTNDCAADVPHALLAVTVIFPLEALAVAAMELLTEVPLHPEGNVQEKEDAPLTAPIV